MRFWAGVGRGQIGDDGVGREPKEGLPQPLDEAGNGEQQDVVGEDEEAHRRDVAPEPEQQKRPAPPAVEGPAEEGTDGHRDNREGREEGAHLDGAGPSSRP